MACDAPYAAAAYQWRLDNNRAYALYHLFLVEDWGYEDNYYIRESLSYLVRGLSCSLFSSEEGVKSYTYPDPYSSWHDFILLVDFKKSTLKKFLKIFKKIL